MTSTTEKPLASAIEQEKLRLFMKEIVPHIFGGAFGVLLIQALFYEQSETAAMVVWLSVHGVLTLAGLALAWHYRRVAEHAQLQFWRRLILVAGAAWGIGWGLAPLLFLDTEDPVYIVTLISILIGVCATPATTFALYLPAYLLFITPVLGALAWQITQLQFGQSLLVKSLTPIFWLFLAGYGRNLQRLLINSIRLRLDNARAFAEARQANLAKSRFLAAASHDIRQPMQALHLFSSALENDLKTNSNAPLFENMRQSLDDMSELLSSLLDVSRLDSGQITSHPQHVPLDTLLAPLVTQYRELAARKGLTFDVRLPSRVAHVDPVLLRRIIGNLLNNALRYTESGGIRLHLLQYPDALQLEVADTGPGIAPEAQQRVFEEFVQLDNPARDRRKGLGLGLSIVQRLARIAELPLSMDSTPGEGTRFSVRIPPGDPAQVAQENTASDSGKLLSSARVLIVDDDALVRDALTLTMEKWGAQVVQASDSEQALAHVREQTPTLILCDRRLGEQTGEELIRACRKQSQQTIPALLLTGDTDPSVMESLKHTGLPILHKPVRVPQLRLAVQRLIRQGQ